VSRTDGAPRGGEDTGGDVAEQRQKMRIDCLTGCGGQRTNELMSSPGAPAKRRSPALSLISGYDYHRRRAERVLHRLRGLWGDELPAGPEPELTVLIDAVAGDDSLGSQDGYVVQSDRLTYETLALLLRRCSTPEIAARPLPRELLSRVFAASTQRNLTHPGFDDPGFDDPGFDNRGFDNRGFDNRGFDNRGFDNRGFDNRYPLDKHHDSPKGSHEGSPYGCGVRGFADPSQAVGTWHLDGEQLLLSWDETCAALLERQDAPRCIEVMEEVEVWTHPEDRAALAEGWQRCIQDAVPHQARFRTLRPGGGHIPCFAAGRRIIDAAGKVHVVGFLQHDEPARHQPS
jgi:PAS domain-containing protein